ncbi:MAG: type II secretion system protein GspN [Thermodesulfobacteriota bacterium]
MAIQMKGKKALQAVIFILLGVFLFILFLYIVFPYETLKRRIIGELEAKTPFRYEIEEIRPHPLSGLTFKNIGVYAPVYSKKVEVLGVERLRITLSLLPLVWGKVSLRFWGRMLDGTVDGDFFKKGRGGELTLVGRDVNLQRIHFLREVKGVEMAGILKGKTMIALRKGDLSGQSGSAEFQISEAVLTRLPLPGIAPFPVGQIQGNIELDHGKVIIKRLISSGANFNGQVLGNIFLNSHLPQSRLNLKITIKPSGKFDPRYRMLLSLLGRQGKTKGIYAFSLKGTLLHPRLVTK